MNKFTCGHEGVTPPNMGRGAARIRRLIEYFNRNCQACAVEHIRESVNSLTDRFANPLPDDVKVDIFNRRIAKLHY